MADFCLECVEELWGDQGGRNDFEHPGAAGPSWHLCESCGVHAFDDRGQRVCRRPQSDFSDEDGRHPSWPDPCRACAELSP
jgi:hypothetical protein